MNRKGQALVEFVLILPIFIMILFSIVDFGMIFNKKNELENISVDVVNMLNKDIPLEEIKSEYADIDMAVKVIYNAKTSRIGVCNACESLVIHL